MIHKGGAYHSSKGLVESWEIDTNTGIKTYTAGNRAGQKEQVMEPMAPATPDSGTDTVMNPMATVSPDSGDNTLMWLGIAVSVIGIGWFFFGKNKRKKK